MPRNDLQSALDGARLVRFSDDGLLLGVWHGGHTVNFYVVNTLGRTVGGNHPATVTPATCASVGDYETGETTREDASAAMDDHFADREALAHG